MVESIYRRRTLWPTSAWTLMTPGLYVGVDDSGRCPTSSSTESRTDCERPALPIIEGDGGRGVQRPPVGHGIRHVRDLKARRWTSKRWVVQRYLPEGLVEGQAGWLTRYAPSSIATSV